jgi:phosphatidylglycerol---prolipoprotein diacylglyceryl transferase
LLHYPNFNPVAFQIGPVKISDYVIGPLLVHWYGIMYLLGFLLAWTLGVYRAKTKETIWSGDRVGDRFADFIFYAALGVIIGGRLGSVFFYNIHEFLKNPVMLFEIWQGGMSFHGGVIGVITAVAFYAWRNKMSFLDLTDYAVPLIPIGLGLGRLGNFINGELWGRVTNVPWAMVFPNAPGNLPRHPSQLYELFLEGIVLFIILWVYSSKPRPRASTSGLFVLLYGVFRFSVEFFRQPDANLGFLFNTGWLTMGQLLSLPMIFLGAIIVVASYKKARQEVNMLS